MSTAQPSSSKRPFVIIFVGVLAFLAFIAAMGIGLWSLAMR